MGLLTRRQWLYVVDPAQFKLGRISTAGGKPEALSDFDIPDVPFTGATLSRDGKTLALFVGQEDPQSHVYTSKIVLVSADAHGKNAARSIALDPHCNVGTAYIGPAARNAIHFTPDGKAVALLIEDQGVDNIWVQPLDGSRGREITHFHSENIHDFRWSLDGKHLAVIRFHSTGDAILLHDTIAAQ